MTRPEMASPGATILPKLKFEHINLNSFSRMRVDLAVQVILDSCVTKKGKKVH